MSSETWSFVAIFCIVNLKMDCYEEFVGMFKLFIPVSDFMLPAFVLPKN
jgi:hypothetical protein